MSRPGSRAAADVIAEVFPAITVFFSDIIGFTSLAAKLAPYETVRLLNSLFDRFDERVEKHGVERIRTIRHSHMTVCGALYRDPLHRQHVAKLALEALDFIQPFSKACP